MARKIIFHSNANPEMEQELEKEYPDGTPDDEIAKDFHQWVLDSLEGAIGWYDKEDKKLKRIDD